MKVVCSGISTSVLKISSWKPKEAPTLGLLPEEPTLKLVQQSCIYSIYFLLFCRIRIYLKYKPNNAPAVFTHLCKNLMRTLAVWTLEKRRLKMQLQLVSSGEIPMENLPSHYIIAN
jgi:hypothetical protein